jgi:hypothetical protein
LRVSSHACPRAHAVRTSLVVVAVYGTMYATWRPQRPGADSGQYAPTYARIPIDEQFVLEVLGGTLYSFKAGPAGGARVRLWERGHRQPSLDTLNSE